LGRPTSSPSHAVELVEVICIADTVIEMAGDAPVGDGHLSTPQVPLATLWGGLLRLRSRLSFSHRPPTHPVKPAEVTEVLCNTDAVIDVGPGEDADRNGTSPLLPAPLRGPLRLLSLLCWTLHPPIPQCYGPLGTPPDVICTNDTVIDIHGPGEGAALGDAPTPSSLKFHAALTLCLTSLSLAHYRTPPRVLRHNPAPSGTSCVASYPGNARHQSTQIPLLLQVIPTAWMGLRPQMTPTGWEGEAAPPPPRPQTTAQGMRHV
jgi:hypothetical protein